MQLHGVLAVVTVVVSAATLVGLPGTTSAQDATGDRVPTYRVTDLHPSGGDYSMANAVNDKGDVVGDAFIDGMFRAFLWRDGVTSLLGDPGLDGFAADINNRGQIVGSSGDHAVLWQDGVTTDLGTLGGPSSFALAINDRGQIVGAADTSSGDVHAAMWQRGRIIDLGPLRVADINSSGAVVGMTESRDIFHAYRWQRGHLVDLGTLGGAVSNATAVNNRGQIVGESETTEGPAHAFVWQRGVMRDLGTLPGGIFSYAGSLNERGQIIGSSVLVTGEQRPVAWFGGSPIDLTTRGFPLRSLGIEINNGSDIAGYIDTPAGSHAALFTSLFTS